MSAQKTLLNFFSPKPTPKPKAAEAAAESDVNPENQSPATKTTPLSSEDRLFVAAAAAASAEAKATETNTIPSSSAAASRSTGIGTRAPPGERPGDELVGSHILVTLDKTEHKVYVRGFIRGRGLHDLIFQDETEKTLDLAFTPWKHVVGEESSSEDDDDVVLPSGSKRRRPKEAVALEVSKKDEKQPSKRLRSKRVRKTVLKKKTLFDDSDEEEEEEEVEEEDDEPWDAKAVSESEEEEDDEEALESLVSEDEEEEEEEEEDFEEEVDLKALKRGSSLRGRSSKSPSGAKSSSGVKTPKSTKTREVSDETRQAIAEKLQEVEEAGSLSPGGWLHRRNSVGVSAMGVGAGLDMPRSSGRKKVSVTDGGGGGGDSRVLNAGEHLHNFWPFITTNRKDKNGKRPGEEGFDPSTLLLKWEEMRKPGDSKKTGENVVTPAMAQWWKFKAENFDTVLLFKVGKFYETYHMDADTLVRACDCVYMKGEMAHAGFPEISFGRMADALVNQGYRVARVEQTETPKQLKERASLAPTGKKPKVVQRELCAVTSAATQRFSHMEEDEGVGNAAPAPPSAARMGEARPLMAVAEIQGSLGVAVADVATGLVRIGALDTDVQRTELRTLLASLRPAELVLPPDASLSEPTKRFLHYDAAQALLSKPPLSAFDPSSILQTCIERDYWTSESTPPTLRTAAPATLAAFAGLVSHLTRCLVDHAVLSMHRIEPLTETGKTAAEKQEPAAASGGADLSWRDVDRSGARMVLDGPTLVNLEVLENSWDGSKRGTLLQLLDTCVTPGGKRRLRQWLCAPLLDRSDILRRQRAVEDLMRSEVKAEVDKAKTLLSKVPDVERALARMHALGSEKLATDHPDARAIMYEADRYAQRKLRDLSVTLRGLEYAEKAVKAVAEIATSDLLRLCTVEAFPELSERLNMFREKFDLSRAEKEGKVRPQPGSDEVYDAARARVDDRIRALEAYLEDCKKRLQCSTLSFFGRAQNRFQIQVPESVAARASVIPSDWTLESQQKGKFRRYYSPELKDLIEELKEAKEGRDEAELACTRRLFERFDRDRERWLAACECATVLDVLLAFARWSSTGDGGGAMCRPTFVDGAVLQIRGGRHPSVTQALLEAGKTGFVPNDIELGTDSEPAKCALLTGPNMGGKSTLLRQACVCTLLAQLGVYVPASSCTLSPADRIFTRVGATDRILAGQSTFFVELSETAAILLHATKHSLVILDELGRGTSTFDGSAIASAVTRQLADSIGARTLFATHYHDLTDEFSHHSSVTLKHMSCIVRQDPERSDKPPDVTFLYRLADGPCPKSHGLNVARLARLPEAIIDVAAAKSAEFETALQAAEQDIAALRIAAQLQKIDPEQLTDDQISQLVSQLQI